MTQHFTHLHLHTEYSLLDGAIRLDQVVSFGKEQGLKALAITDHGNVFGAVKFFQKCKKAGIKPILGMEAYLTEDATIKQADNKYYHLIILVQNEIGYRNLCKLISFSFQEGFYFKPRIDYRVLEKYSEGLVVTTACLGGHIPKLLMSDQHEEVQKRMKWFSDVFSGRFYLEVQPEDQKEQTILNQKLYELSAYSGVPLLAAGDCHYPSLNDREAHEIMLSIQTHDKLDNPDRYTFGDCRVYMRTQDEMLEVFKEHPQAVWNSGVIADSCNFEFQTDKLFFPQFALPSEHTPETFFRYQCQSGLERLIKNGLTQPGKDEEYKARLTLEMDLITSMGFIGYFLVVSDFIQWAYKEGIPVGPGRGSAAGSLVAWALQITNIDPLRYNLLFERFLNPERVSMPDIDIDFCIEGRDSVINYVRNKYGHDKVCHIITFGTMMAKGVIKDVARVLGMPFEDSNALTNLVSDQLKITLKEAIEQEPRLQEMIDNNPRVHKVFEIAFKLEGLTRHASKHAAGIVISPDPIDTVLPVYVPPKSDELVAQYAMTELESIGFLKIDLLGLKNLTLIDRAVKLIHKNHGILLDMNHIPLDDEKTFKLLCAGLTSGVFQLESNGLKDVLRKLQPDKFEDIIAVNALYRPGPLGSGMVDDYIERRHGRQPIHYLFPELEESLKETYGVIVYQEQVMKIASMIGGYSLGEADILRRAMGKKKAEVMAEQREIFLKRSESKGFNGSKAAELFDLMAYFAGYGFNKSHSAAYALIAYQTAYLKANYPAEFMACLISLEAANAEKMAFYLQEARDMGLTILPPDINTSQIEFSVIEGALLFGLQGIKNVGHAALENIIAERTKKPYLDLLDFCKRIDLRTSNKRVIEHLIYAGAFDNLPGNRAQQYAALALIIDQATAWKRDAATGQMGLFKSKHTSTLESSAELYTFEALPDWNDQEKLEKEKEVIGFYLSSHPLKSHEKYIQWFGSVSFDRLTQTMTQNPVQERSILAAGLLKKRKDIVTKKGDRMSFLELEDMTGHAEVIVFPKTFARCEQRLNEHTLFFVRGTVDPTSTTHCKIKAEDIIPIEKAFDEIRNIHELRIQLPEIFDDSLLKTIKDMMTPGSTPLAIRYQENQKLLEVRTTTGIEITHQLINKLHIAIKNVSIIL